MRTEERAGVATRIIGIAVVIVVIAITFYAVLALGPSATTTSSGTPTSTAVSSGLGTTSEVSSSTSIANPSSSQAYAYLEATGGCTAGGAPAPCWGGSSANAYVFPCQSQARTEQGCIQTVQVTATESFTVATFYPFTNSTAPLWANCLWELRGSPAAEAGWAYCSTVGAGSFIVGTLEAPPQASG